MSSSPNVSKMSVSDYIEYLESSSLQLGIDAEDLNDANFFVKNTISLVKYDRTNTELIKRRINCINK